MSPPRIEIFPDAAALAARAAQWIVDLACHSSGRFSICLSGGSTPKRLYQLLAAAPFRDIMPWPRTHWFWGDERFVPWDSPDSNYGMARDALLAHVLVPPENIHGIETNGSLADAAHAYEQVLKSYAGSDRLDPARPIFDIMLIGLGPDGHTASLFPGKPALNERHRWTVEVPEPGLNPMVPRVTLTYPALESCRSAAFLVAGADKTAALAGALAGRHDLPSARFAPVGELIWFVDQAAKGGA
jgi:6-phosphogluconolactonase